jgi:hypothetical protein
LNDKECYKCHKKGHPATHCPKKPNDDDDRSTASAASSVKKLKKDIKSIKKAFTTVSTQLSQLKEADSDISESEGEEASHFQLDQALQFAQLDKKLEPRISKLFKQAGYSIKLDLLISRRLSFSTVNPLWISSVTYPWQAKLASQDPICNSRAMAAP